MSTEFYSKTTWENAFHALMIYAAEHRFFELLLPFIWHWTWLWLKHHNNPVNIRIADHGITLSYCQQGMYHFATHFQNGSVSDLIPASDYKSWKDCYSQLQVNQGL